MFVFRSYGREREHKHEPQCIWSEPVASFVYLFEAVAKLDSNIHSKHSLFVNLFENILNSQFSSVRFNFQFYFRIFPNAKTKLK